jgi:pyridoxine 5-phosphate synthase
MAKLGVNVDHVATLRQARRTDYPDPLEAALAAERAGAQAITLHLREDRRHVQDHDLFRIRQAISVHLNQEMAPVAEMAELAVRIRPDEACIVPERRQELTTEGGLDLHALGGRLAPIIKRLKGAGITVSLFIEPDPELVHAAAALGTDCVELHTGKYAALADADLSRMPAGRKPPLLGEAALAELGKIRAAARKARALKLKCNAGHGLNYRNVTPVAAIAGLEWFHIGHAIVARALMVGMTRAVREMQALIVRRSVRNR